MLEFISSSGGCDFGVGLSIFSPSYHLLISPLASLSLLKNNLSGGKNENFSAAGAEVIENFVPELEPKFDKNYLSKLEPESRRNDLPGPELGQISRILAGAQLHSNLLRSWNQLGLAPVLMPVSESCSYCFSSRLGVMCLRDLSSNRLNKLRVYKMFCH